MTTENAAAADTTQRTQLLLEQALQHLDAGSVQPALARLIEANRLEPANVHVLNAMGSALAQMGRVEESLQVFAAGISVAPNAPELHYNNGMSLWALRRHGEALESYNRALELNPDYPEALTNRGLVLHALRRVPEALADHDMAVTLQPNYVWGHINRGMALQTLGHFDEALAAYDLALELNPQHPEARASRGALMSSMERFDEALDDFQRAISLHPKFERAHQAEGYLRLLLGDFERGWPKFEWRQGGTYSSQQNKYPQLPWRPETQASGKRVMLYGSYSLGETIQFARYVEMVAATGAVPVVVVPPRLKALFAGLKGSPEIVGDDDPMPQFDFHRSLMSLPFLFKTTLDTIPRREPYFVAADDLIAKWNDRLGPNDGRARIGIAWTSAAAGSIPIDDLARLAGSNARLIALQRGEALPVSIESVGDDIDPETSDYADLAALVANLDLVIVPDSPIAHLAGALGKPTWLALPSVSGWQWLRDRSDSPWYPSMRLFRQKTRGDWKPVFAEIAAALAAKG